MTRKEQMLNGFTEMMKGFWNNQDLEVPNLETPCKQEPCDDSESKKIIPGDIDKEEIAKSVEALDLFTKFFCRYSNDYERFGDLKFRCNECPFQQENGKCLAKIFKNKYAPNYRNFGSMGDL